MKIRSRSLLPAHEALVDQVSGTPPAALTGMRDLLRDTALLVTSIATDGKSESFDSLRTYCKQLVEQFGGMLKQRGYSDDLCEDAQTAQCALLDEIALGNLALDDRDRWSLQPLQVETFQQHDAGERVFERLEFRMREHSPQVDLLECYATVLSLGFIGRYAIDQMGKRVALVTELNALLKRLRPAEERSFIIDQPGMRFSGWFRRLSPWAISGIACAIAVIVWLGWHFALDAQIASLTSKTVKP